MTLKPISADTIRLIQQWIDLCYTIQSDLESQGRTDLRSAFPVSDVLEYLGLKTCLDCGELFEPSLIGRRQKYCDRCEEARFRGNADLDY